MKVRGSVCVVLGMMGLGVAVAQQVEKAAKVAVKDLPVRKEMPDPLVMNDGSKVVTVEQWRKRREEMKVILEDWEYGHMPPPPGNVVGKVIVAAKTLANGKVTYRLVHLTFGPPPQAGKEEALGLDVGIFTPVEADGAGGVKGPFATLVAPTFSTGENAGNAYALALGRGYAVATMNYQQMGADNVNYRKTGVFPVYPEYDWNDFSAWAWGISRCVDYLVTDPAVDKEKIVATGASRIGQAVLLAGAFDERIALVAPVAGGMALRFSGKERGGGKGQGIDELVAQNTYWFGPRFEEFKGETERLPCDQHWLLALAAPRAYMLCNSMSDQYGNPQAALESIRAAQPVYAFLGVKEKLGFNFRPGTHGMTAVDWGAVLDFADWQLKGKAAGRKFDEVPEGLR